MLIQEAKRLQQLAGLTEKLGYYLTPTEDPKTANLNITTDEKPALSKSYEPLSPKTQRKDGMSPLGIEKVLTSTLRNNGMDYDAAIASVSHKYKLNAEKLKQDFPKVDILHKAPLDEIDQVVNEALRKFRINEIEDNNADEKAFDAELMAAANAIAGAIGNELKSKDPKQLDEALITATIAGIMTGNAVVGFISKYAAKLFKLLKWNKGEDIAEKIHHWAHDNEMAFQSPIKRVLGFFIKDTKTLDMVTKAIYAIVVGSMAAGYGAQAVDKLSHAEWFKGALTSLKTLAKGDEAIVNAYPVVKSLIA